MTGIDPLGATHEIEVGPEGAKTGLGSSAKSD